MIGEFKTDSDCVQLHEQHNFSPPIQPSAQREFAAVIVDTARETWVCGTDKRFRSTLLHKSFNHAAGPG